MSKMFDEWMKQKRNPHNDGRLKHMEFYDSSINKDQKENTQDNEFKHAKSVPEKEIDSCAHRSLKVDAIHTQNFLATMPENKELNENFLYSQKELRDWRGDYIAKTTQSNHIHDFSSDTQENLNYGGSVLYEVLFSIIDPSNVNTESNSVYTKEPFAVYTRSINYELDKIQPFEIMEIVKTAITNTTEEEIHTQNKTFNKQTIETMIKKIENQYGTTAPDSGNKNSSYFNSLGIDAEHVFEMARFAYKKGKTIENVEIDGQVHGFIFNINKSIPSKSRIYQNPKVVERMTCDIIKSPIPAMHVDLTIYYNMNEEDIDLNKTIQLSWTINKVYLGWHKVTHLTYLSDNTGFYNLPDSLSEIRSKTEQFTNKKLINTYDCKITAKKINRHDDMDIMEFHCYLQRHSLESIKKKLSNPKIEKTTPKQNKNYAFIYEYNPNITIVANTTQNQISAKRKGEKDYLNCTSYTIIQWTPRDIKQRFERRQPNQNQNPGSNELVKAVQREVNDMKMQMYAMNTNYQKIIPVEKYGLQVRDIQELDFFVPAILPKVYAQSNSHDPLTTMKGLCLKVTSPIDRIVYEGRKRSIDWELINKCIYPLFGIAPDKVTKESLKEIAINHFANKKKDGTTEFIPPYPGFLGFILEKIHNDPDKYGARYMIPVIKKRSLDWFKYLEDRSKPADLKPASFFTMLNAQINDRNEKKRAIKRIQDGKYQPRPHQNNGNPHKHKQSNQPNVRNEQHNHKQSSGEEQWPALQTSQPRPVKTRKQRVREDIEGMGVTDRDHEDLLSHDPSAYNIHTQDLQPEPKMFSFSKFNKRTPRNTLASAVNSPEFTPSDNTAKLQAEVDNLKRMLNELTLRMSLQTV
jgi:hypothetical protein